jgi:uncharacterized secreted repeat protein (TIGR03808 family)
MTLDRRSLLAGLGITGAAAPLTSLKAAPQALSGLGADVTKLGVRANAPEDQSRTLQEAINAAAGARIPLFFPPGIYRAGDLMLPSGAHLIGVPGASRIQLGYGASLMASSRAEQITLAGLTFDGTNRPLPDKRGLITIRTTRNFSMRDCVMTGIGGSGLVLEGVEGEVTNNQFINAAKAAIFSLDAQGLSIRNNLIRSAGNNGILVWRSEKGDDGTLADNRIEDIAGPGGSGQYGNASNFRAGNVIVRGNRIRNCAFSAVRGNAASNIQIEGNGIVEAREVAIYAEFGFQGAVISGNTVDGAAIGVSVTNFNEGGGSRGWQSIRNLVTPGNPNVDQETRTSASARGHTVLPAT